MKKKSLIHSILPLAIACAALDAAEPSPQEAAIAKTAQAFIEAFHKGDAKAVAAFWAPDGDYIDESGRVFKGRKAIEDNYAEFFAANKGLALRIDVAGLKFPTPDMAIEEGALADLLLVDGDPIADLKLVADPAKNFVVIMKDGATYKNTVKP